MFVFFLAFYVFTHPFFQMFRLLDQVLDGSQSYECCCLAHFYLNFFADVLAFDI